MNDNLSFDADASFKDAEHLIHPVTEEKKDIVYGLHSLGRSYIHHYSSIKLRYKKLAFTWLSALLVGLFFINRNINLESLSDISLDKFYVDALITVLAIVGIKLLSFLDLKVYHPQLDAIFVAEMDLEEKYRFLDEEYISMSKLMHQKYFDPVMIDAIYYVVIEIIVASLGFFSLYLKFRPYHSLSITTTLITCFALFVVYQIGYVFTTILISASRKKSKAFSD